MENKVWIDTTNAVAHFQQRWERGRVGGWVGAWVVVVCECLMWLRYEG